MDDLIYEEFKGTGNMELHLDRKLADRRVFPSINVSRSGTRQEELLYGKEDLAKIHTMRRMLELISEEERTETLLERLKKTKTNSEFLDSLKTV
jgi:transcription termination factor Rho